MISKSKTFLIILISFIIGIAWASFIPPVNNLIYFVILISFLVVLIIGFKKPKIRLISFLGIGLLLGVWRYYFAEPYIDQYHIAFYNEQETNFIGTVSEEVDTRKDHVKLTIKVEKINKPKNIEDAKGKVLVNTSLYPEYQYGDQLDIACRLKTPEKIKDFSYDKYLARFNIYSVCYHPKIRVLARNKSSVILAKLYQIKTGFINKISRILPEPQASFLEGLLIGAKRGIPDHLMEDFNRTSTTHIVAISGYNITIIAVLMLSFCKTIGISRKRSFWVILIALLFFVLVTGAQSSVVRAAIMGILVLIAKRLGRLSRITNALILTAAVMLLINPKVLIFDAGFQLSFSATMGLVYLSPLLENPLSWVPARFQIRESLLATLSATIFTFPLILFQFRRFSVVGLLVNILILPIIPFAMGIGFLAGILSAVWIPLGQLFSWIVWFLLTYIIRLVEVFSKIPFASVPVPKMHWAILVFGYTIIILGIGIVSEKQNRSF